MTTATTPDIARPRGAFGRWWRQIPKNDRIMLALLFGGAAVAGMACSVALAGQGSAATAIVATIGSLALVAGVVGAERMAPLPATRLVPAPTTGVVRRPDRGWTQHKVVAFTLQAHAALAAAAVLFAPFWGIDAAAHMLLTATLAGLIPWTVLHARTHGLRRSAAGTRRRYAAYGVAIAAAVLFVTGAGLRLAGFGAEIAAVLGLSATLCAAILLQLLHKPPTPRDALYDDAVLWPGRPALTTVHAFGMPAAFACAFTAFTLLALLLWHAGTAIISDLALALLGLAIMMAVAGLLAIGAAIHRRDDVPDRWHETRPISTTHTRIVVTSTGLFALLLLFIAAAIAVGEGPWAPSRWIDAVAIAVLVATGPYGFLAARRAKQVRMLEERFPDFLRDLASGRQAGLTLEASVRMATRGDYGALTPEIRRMSAQLTWNLSFEDALSKFARRVRTPLIARAVSLITEANRSGGHVAAVLQAAADDARHRKDVQDTRRAHMRVYTGIIHIGFLVFLGVAAILYATLVPRLVEISAAFSATDAPQVSGLSIVAGVQLADYRTFYFVAALAQAVGNGLFAGLVATGRVLSGLQHVFFMSAAAAAVFLFFGGA